MRILVAMKHVIDPMTYPALGGSCVGFNQPIENDRIANPFDECALETALRLVECHRLASRSEAQVSVLTIGPESTETMLRHALAVGATDAIRIDATDAVLDGHIVSQVLARAVQDLDVDLVILGKESTDAGGAEVAQRLGSGLGWPQLTAAVSIDMLASGQILAEIGVGGLTGQALARLPAIISVDRRILAVHAVRYDGKSPPGSVATGARYAALPAIIAARRKPLQVHALAHYVTDPRALLRTTMLTGVPHPRACEMLGSVEQLAQSILRDLSGFTSRG